VTPHEFIQKWQAVALSERSACQQHFLDLCNLLAQPKPAADPAGTWYTFERGVSKTGGGQGWADVWLRNHFGWEYKGKHKDLAAAYKQLLQYREDLENPPLLIVCDLDRFEIHTNFTGTAKVVHRFSLADLADGALSPFSALRKRGLTPSALDLLRRALTDAEPAAWIFKYTSPPDGVVAIMGGWNWMNCPKLWAGDTSFTTGITPAPSWPAISPSNSPT
jgi:hypothetical protein